MNVENDWDEEVDYMPMYVRLHETTCLTRLHKITCLTRTDTEVGVNTEESEHTKDIDVQYTTFTNT